MTFASIIMPAFNVQATMRETLAALLTQTYASYEVIIVDDGSTDCTPGIAAQFAADPRVRVIRQANRGLAGARNTGIAAARGDVIGFCDADDLWEPQKLARHVAHLNASPHVGISYSGSALMDDNGTLTGQAQRPRLHDVTASHIFKRNPIGNGSAPVIRRAVFEQIAHRPHHETLRDWYFDETFRQSEDIECWLRIALTTDWTFEGVPGLLTRYRINAGGLSAATDRQLAAWERMVEKLTPLNPAFFTVNTPAARAYQLRYLCRRAISDLDAPRAQTLSRAWVAQSRLPLVEEPVKSVVTLAASAALSAFGGSALRNAMMLARRFRPTGTVQ
ncbi:glycosyltransferase family 2 protein [Pseudosulfitobacter pseudonitzschiae]|uniref:glycosyltransferase family 2 protein n=1 Tax=Pseudosulfitobacter pseudonitzschiae TaxID=1402135 RepID=UPI001AF07055|nr:glycosyltransferase family 2 protein [Pseudosulfitobacter pseudonitzschiae]MBM1816348.1 glycosyltransferase family 2 protein [Pseudosulfitobacter pseudonitzschiae]MBM1833861.1 glycosyltransferase family 2 protein [Pseudosulfitobacter pseudonitzschiae]MBM1838727.1 glycosyltransferase family 2 protein [Pseudosulfitobacter pseudonitzschiae]MBM1843075.1 glycosyltransferase family 2 protein [Pseudosulfitobacter pseudonitzschiae]MBM1847941.1 glycosyltransferase family 2 protein [Pseudosulfitobact